MNPLPCDSLYVHSEVSPPPPPWWYSKPFPIPQHLFSFLSSCPPVGEVGCDRGCEVISVDVEEETQMVPVGRDPTGTS